MKNTVIRAACILLTSTTIYAVELHVSVNGSDANSGTMKTPFRTIQHAADLAQPGDVIMVHEGVYRERIDPPRGGNSNADRITYQAVPGENVVITGAEPMKGWVRLTNDTWRVSIPNSFFWLLQSLQRPRAWRLV